MLYKSKKGRRGGVVGSILEALEPRQLLSSSISGNLWNDANANKLRDAAEAGLSGWTVYLDQNRSRTRDAGEAFTLTNANGDYTFAGLNAGTYSIATEALAGWQLTSPALTSVTLGSTSSGTVNVPAAVASTFIGLDDLRSDPRFARADGTGYSIVIIDSGIDADHTFFGPDLDGNGVSDRIVYRADFDEYMDPAMSTPDDVTNHGTAVAGIAAGSSTTNPGVASGANIISLKIVGGATGFFTPLERALQWTIANADRFNIVAVSMSVADGETNYLNTIPSNQVTDEFATLSQMGVISIAAAGNFYGRFNTPGAAYPAVDPNVIAVGAVYVQDLGQSMDYGNNAIDYTTGPDRLIAFSQRMPGMVFAPGITIVTAQNGGGTTGFTGTSAAAPYIGGTAVVAQNLADMILGRRLTVTEFRSVLQTSGHTIFDGDDENDSVTNTNTSYKRLDIEALAEAIWNLGDSYPTGQVVTVDGTQNTTGRDFGARVSAGSPGSPVLDASSDTGQLTSDGVTRFNGSNGKLSFIVPKTVAGSTIKLYGNGALLATVVGKAGVTWVTLGGTTLLDGQYQITATQTLPGLQESAASAVFMLTIDTVAPVVVAPDLIDADDSGISSADNITNASSLTFNLGAANYYSLYRNGVRITYSFDTVTQLSDTGSMADGTYSYYVAGADLAGNVANSGATQVVRDSSAWPSAPGIETTFGNNNGYAKFTSTVKGFANAVAVRADGKILVGGETNDAGGRFPQVTRLNADGSIDQTFGASGWFTYTAAGSDGSVSDVIALPNNQVMVSAVINNRILIFRLNENGALDPSFASAGVLNLGLVGLTTHTLLRRMSDGRLVAAIAQGNAVVVQRFSANGLPDNTFNGNGTATVTITGQEWIVLDGFSVAADGTVTAVGRSADWKSQYVLRMKPNGTPDTSFHASGYALVQISTLAFAIRGMGVQADGKIVIAATDNANSGSNQATLLTRFNTNGTLDTTFGSGGIVLQHFLSNVEDVKDMAIDANGKILVAYDDYAPTVMRFNADGTPDGTFGPGGVRKVPTGDYGVARAIDLAADGTIYIAGSWQYGTVGFSYIVSKIRADAGAAPALVLQAASDTGVSNSDGVTSDHTPTFDLPTAPAGHYFRVFANGVKVGSDYLSGGAFTAPSLANGAYAFSVMVIDTAGNASSMSNPISVTIQDDTPAPTPLTGAITPVSPDPRTTPVSSIIISFSNAVTGFTTARLSLTRNGSAVGVTGATLSTSDSKTFVLNGLASLTTAAGNYVLTLNGGSIIQDANSQTLPGSISESWTINAVVTTPPAAPSSLAGTVVSSNQINLNWTDNASNEAGYEIQRSLVYNFVDPTNVTVNTANLTGYSDTTLTQNTYYYFRVRAMNAAGVSAWTSSVKLKTTKAGSTPAPTAPAVPTGPSATANSASQITFKWTDASSNETGFRIQRSTSSSFATFSEFTVDANTTQYVDTNLAASTTYYYRAQSYNAVGGSSFTSNVSATTQATAPTIPAAPTAPSATVDSSTQITVKWTDASNNETDFRIQRSTSSSFATFSEFTVGQNISQYVDTNLAANTTYYYRVLAYNAVGPSNFTTAVNAKTLATTPPVGPISAPSSIAGTPARTSVALTWIDNANNEAGFEIQISSVYNFTAGTTTTVIVPTLDAAGYTVAGLDPYTWYYFRVRAVNGTVVSGWTSSVKLKTLR